MASEEAKYIYSHAKYGYNNYAHQTDCDWSIVASTGKNVHLTFLSFQLEDEKDCNYDYVEIYSGQDSSGPSFGRLCGDAVSIF